jgi:hypothetical protein
MVVVTTNTLARHQPLPDPLFPARKLVLLPLAGYVILSYRILWGSLIAPADWSAPRFRQGQGVVDE